MAKGSKVSANLVTGCGIVLRQHADICSSFFPCEVILLPFKCVVFKYTVKRNVHLQDYIFVTEEIETLMLLC